MIMWTVYRLVVAFVLRHHAFRRRQKYPSISTLLSSPSARLDPVAVKTTVMVAICQSRSLFIVAHHPPYVLQPYLHFSNLGGKPEREKMGSDMLRDRSAILHD